MRLQFALTNNDNAFCDDEVHYAVRTTVERRGENDDEVNTQRERHTQTLTRLLCPSLRLFPCRPTARNREF